MAQSCMIVGNIANIKKIENTNKVYVTIADHISVKNAEGKYEQRPNYVDLQGFVPEGLKLEVGMLLCADFRVVQYKTKKTTPEGKPIYDTANEVIGWDVTLRSPGKKAGAAEAAAQAAAEAPVPEGAGVPVAE